MPLARTTLWWSAATHGALIAAVIVAGGTTGRRSRELPPVVTMCFEQAPAAEPEAVDVPPIATEECLAAPLVPDTEIVPPDPVRPEDAAQSTPFPERVAAAATLSSRVAMVPVRRPAAVVAPEPPPPPAATASASPVAKVLAPLDGANPPPDYPPAARRRGLQGTVVILVVVDEHGDVTAASVQRSSGHALLDEAALAAVRRWRFQEGPGVSEQPIEFRLRR